MPQDDSVLLTPATLRTMPLPQPGAGGDKNERGRVLIVGGATEMPGAIILAATGALRAGTGKLQVATAKSVAPLVALALPEARVFGLPETPAGDIDPEAASQIVERAAKNDAVLLGPGMVDEDGAGRLAAEVARGLSEKPDNDTVLVLDAAALAAVRGTPSVLHALRGRAVLTPHSGEMASALDRNKDEIESDPAGVARRAARDLQAVVALKGRVTFIAAPNNDAPLYRNEAGNVGLATSGSGDTLAGIVAGLVARGAAPQQAAAWGVYLHAAAGDRVAEQIGPLGFLARELLDAVPRLMAVLSAGRGSEAQ